MELKILQTKNIVLWGLCVSIIFLIVAGINYPGGNPTNSTSIGFSWTENYISNLLEYKAVNGMDNKARPFGVIGVVLLGLSLGLAFFRLSGKVRSKKYSVVIKYLGLVLILFSALITIPGLHDTMITFSSLASLLLFFYVCVLLIQTKLLALKIVSIVLLLISYGASYMYFLRTGLDYLPLIQKLIHVFQIILILGLEYASTKEDFDKIKS